MIFRTIDIENGRVHKREMLLDDETLVSWLYVLDIPMRIGSAEVWMAGIGGVHTSSEHRKKGYMRMLFENTVDYMIDQGYDVSMLFGIPNFYTKFGYAVTMPTQHFTLTTREAETVDLNDSPSLYVRPIAEDDMEQCITLYNTNNTLRTLSVIRKPGIFKAFRLGTHWGATSESHAWFDNEGTLRAYAVWDKDATKVNVTEVEADDPALFPLLLATFAEIAVEKRCEHITIYLPMDHPFAEYCQRFGVEWSLRFPRYGDNMSRILNQDALFHKLECEFSRHLANSPFRWEGDLAIQTDLGKTGLSIVDGRVTAGTPKESAELFIIPQNKLAQLLAGYRSVRDVCSDADVTADEALLPLLNALFVKEHGYIWHADYF